MKTSIIRPLVVICLLFLLSKCKVDKLDIPCVNVHTTTWENDNLIITIGNFSSFDCSNIEKNRVFINGKPVEEKDILSCKNDTIIIEHSKDIDRAKGNIYIQFFLPEEERLLCVDAITNTIDICYTKTLGNLSVTNPMNNDNPVHAKIGKEIVITGDFSESQDTNDYQVYFFEDQRAAIVDFDSSEELRIKVPQKPREKSAITSIEVKILGCVSGFTDNYFVYDYTVVEDIVIAGKIRERGCNPNCINLVLGVDARFSRPAGLTITERQNEEVIYVADHQAHVIHKITPNGNQYDVKLFVGACSEEGILERDSCAARLNSPAHLEFSRDSSYLYFTEDINGNSVIRRIDINAPRPQLYSGKYMMTEATISGSSRKDIYYKDPLGITIDSDNVYITDPTQQQIFVVNKTSGIVNSLNINSSIGNGNFKGITIDQNGVLYVVDSFDKFILRLLNF